MEVLLGDYLRRQYHKNVNQLFQVNEPTFYHYKEKQELNVEKLRNEVN